MSSGYVFGTEAIMAFLYTEPGHEAVATLLDEVFSSDADGFLTETNWVRCSISLLGSKASMTFRQTPHCGKLIETFVRLNGRDWSLKRLTGGWRQR